jgi:GntR family transcriptional regulator, carbon starvation induced regulator
MAALDANAKSMTAKVFAQLRRNILEARFAPGTKLRLDDLRIEYEVSLSPLREALSRLAAEGLVIADDQRGFRVAPASLADLDDLTMLRCEIEGLALARSVELGDDGWEADLVRAHHHLLLLAVPSGETLAGSALEWESRHHAFHEALAAGCQSPRVLQLRSQLFDQFNRYLRIGLTVVGATRDAQSEHKALVDAALARDSKRCVELIHMHIRLTAEVVRAARFLDDRSVTTLADEFD